jgi:hypothetical protein
LARFPTIVGAPGPLDGLDAFDQIHVVVDENVPCPGQHGLGLVGQEIRGVAGILADVAVVEARDQTDLALEDIVGVRGMEGCVS